MKTRKFKTNELAELLNYGPEDDDIMIVREHRVLEVNGIYERTGEIVFELFDDTQHMKTVGFYYFEYSIELKFVSDCSKPIVDVYVKDNKSDTWVKDSPNEEIELLELRHPGLVDWYSTDDSSIVVPHYPVLTEEGQAQYVYDTWYAHNDFDFYDEKREIFPKWWTYIPNDPEDLGK